VKEIVLDASQWKNKRDFYNAFFKAIGITEWDERHLQLLLDEVNPGANLNLVNLPYMVRIGGTSQMPEETAETVKRFCEFIKELQAKGYQIDVICE
jgi:RNAse (barnase) inhibitor barstar